MEACIEELESAEQHEYHECEEHTDRVEPVSRVEKSSAANPACPIATVSQKSPFCFMCHFHGNAVCDKATIFVIDSISHISFSYIIDQLFEHLHNSFPDEDINRQQLSTHIREHMLHPRIKVARMIHRLSEMQASITQNIVSHDAESEQTIIDASAVKLFAVLSNQISSLYRLDEDKLMFKNVSMDK